MSRLGGLICLACGRDLPDSLRWTASLRCHDCREANALLRAELGRLERELRVALLEQPWSDPPELSTAA
jgi:hypothetical protein